MVTVRHKVHVAQFIEFDRREFLILEVSAPYLFPALRRQSRSWQEAPVKVEIAPFTPDDIGERYQLGITIVLTADRKAGAYLSKRQEVVAVAAGARDGTA